MRIFRVNHLFGSPRRWFLHLGAVIIASAVTATPAQAQDQIYFPAVDNVTPQLVAKINAETVRIDISASLLSERAISQALVDRFNDGVAVRLIGDRFSLFENLDASTRLEFYWLASQGIPIRVRTSPTWYPEVAHWQATIFVGQNEVSFGTANYTPAELGPTSATNYTDQTVLFTTDADLVRAFKAQFDRMWNDSYREIGSKVGHPPYFKDWNDACAAEAACADYATRYPSPDPMLIDRTRLEPDAATPPDLIWGQGAAFNNRAVTEIENEDTFVDLVASRLTVDNVTDALLAKHALGIPVRIIVEPDEYRNRRFPEFWLTGAKIDRLWAAGIPIKKRAHAGLTQMKMLVTSSHATIASANFSSAWQRDHNYFVSAEDRPEIYRAMRDRFDTMWNDASGFVTFTPEPPDTPNLKEPANSASDVPTNVALVWQRTAFATNYDVYVGTSPEAMDKIGSVPVTLVNDPPQVSSWRPAGLDPFTTYYWKIVARTNASRSASSSTRSFTTGEAATLTVSPSSVEVGATGGSGGITITASGAWAAVSSEPWVTITPSSGTGNGKISYTVSHNDSPGTRTATISVDGVLISITQAADTVPGTPRSLTASFAWPRVTFAWLPANDGGTARQYQVEFATNPAFSGATVRLTEGAPLRFVVSHLAVGLYYARVSAVNNIGVSNPSDVVTFTFTGPPSGGGGGGGTPAPSPAPAPPHPPSPTVPEAPGNVRWNIVGSTVTIAWDAPTAGGPVLSYLLQVGLAPGRTDYSLPTGSPIQAVTYTGVPNGVYYLRIHAIRADGVGPASPEKPLAVGQSGPAPAAPANLSAAVAGSQVTLQWSPSAQGDASPVTHYVLEAGFSPGASNAAIMPVGAQTVIGVGGVPSGVYYVRVRAANGSTLSAPSNEVRVVVR